MNHLLCLLFLHVKDEAAQKLREKRLEEYAVKKAKSEQKVASLLQILQCALNNYAPAVVLMSMNSRAEDIPWTMKQCYIFKTTRISLVGYSPTVCACVIQCVSLFRARRCCQVKHHPGCEAVGR